MINKSHAPIICCSGVVILLCVVRQVCLAGPYTPPTQACTETRQPHTIMNVGENLSVALYFFPLIMTFVFLRFQWRSEAQGVSGSGAAPEPRASHSGWTHSGSGSCSPVQVCLSHTHTHTHSEKIGAPSCSHKWTSMQFESFAACHSLPQFPVTLAMTHIMRVHSLPQPSFALLLQSHCVTAPRTLIRLVCWLETPLLAKPFHTTITGKIC